MSNKENIPYESLNTGDILQEGDEVLVTRGWIPFDKEAWGKPLHPSSKARRPALRVGERYLTRCGAVVALGYNNGNHCATHPREIHMGKSRHVLLPNGMGGPGKNADDLVARVLSVGEALQEGDLVKDASGCWVTVVGFSIGASLSNTFARPIIREAVVESKNVVYSASSNYAFTEGVTDEVTTLKAAVGRLDAEVGRLNGALHEATARSADNEKLEDRIKSLKAAVDILDADTDRLHGLWHEAEERCNIEKVNGAAWQAEAEKWRKVAEDNFRTMQGWEATATEMSDGVDFYRGVVHEIGNMFGLRARISDDGSIQEEVLALKVPELVQELIVTLDTIVE